MTDRLTDERQTCDLCGGTGEIWLPIWMEDGIGRYVLRQYVGPCEQCSGSADVTDSG